MGDNGDSGTKTVNGVPIQCSTCPAFVPIPNARNAGECRSGPPSVMMVPQQRPMLVGRDVHQGVQMGIGSFWPRVGSEGWCCLHPRYAEWVQEQEAKHAEETSG